MDHEYLKKIRLENAEREAEDSRNAAQEATALDPLEDMLKADATFSLPELWFELADQLKVAPNQAADLVERIATREGRATLYALTRYGLYSAMREPRASEGGYWISAWNAGQSSGWSREWCLDFLDFLRLSAQDADIVRGAAGLLQGGNAERQALNTLDLRRQRDAIKLAPEVQRPDCEVFGAGAQASNSQGASSALHPRAESTYLTIIGALLELVRNPRPGRDSDAAVIRELIENYSDKPGIAKSTLEGKFADARRQLRAP